MVTWGANTVHTIAGSNNESSNSATAIPPISSFGAAPPLTTIPASNAAPTSGFSFAPRQAPAGGLFGATAPSPLGTAPTASGGSSSLFGAPSAPSSGLFGAPATPGTSFFGAPPSAAGGGLFGYNAAPAPPTGGLFSFSSPPAMGGAGLLGTTTTAGGGLFGSAPPAAVPQQQQQPQIPAHAALQAHIDASARNEEARVLKRIQTIYEAYNLGGGGVMSDEQSHCFSTVLYSPVTQQQRQFQAAYTSMMSLSIQGQEHQSSQMQMFVPPKPPQISQNDWNTACVRNPNSADYMPVAVVGAECLTARAISHQSQADTLYKYLEKLTEAVAHLNQRHAAVIRQLEDAKKTNETQRFRLLKVLKHVEVARCFNIPLQAAEAEAHGRMRHLKHRVVEGQLVTAIKRIGAQQQQQELQSHKTIPTAARHSDDSELTLEMQEQWMNVLKGDRATIAKLGETIESDKRDLQLISERVASTGNVRRPPSFM